MTNVISVNNCPVRTSTLIIRLTPDKSVGYGDFVAMRLAEQVADAVRSARRKHGWSQAQLAEEITRIRRAADPEAPSASIDTISRIERGENTTTDSIEEIASALGTSTVALLSFPQKDVDDEYVDVSGFTPDDIPVIAEGEASPQGALFWDDAGQLRSDVETRISRPKDLTDPRAYGLVVRGDSMVPRYMPGELLIVAPRATVRSGNCAYVELLSGERLIKRVHRQSGGWNLESLNSVYSPRFARDEEIGVIHKIMYGRSL